MSRASAATLAAVALGIVLLAVLLAILFWVSPALPPEGTDELAANVRALESRIAALEERLADVAERVDAQGTTREWAAADAPRAAERPRDAVPDPPREDEEPERLPWNRPDARVESLMARLDLDRETAARLADVYGERQDGLLRVWRDAPAKGLARHEAMRRVWEVVKKSEAQMAKILTPEQLAKFRQMRGRDHPRGIDFPMRGGKPRAKPAAEPEPEPELENVVF
ncbi:MAG: hypothetical protein ACYS9X_32730 [Planctomycetota bacterium]